MVHFWRKNDDEILKAALTQITLVIFQSFTSINFLKIFSSLHEYLIENFKHIFLFYRNSRNRYFQGRHCTNCNKDGHNMKSCPEPKRRKVCFMCCEEGHLHFQCPKQHCLRCGAENEPYRWVILATVVLKIGHLKLDPLPEKNLPVLPFICTPKKGKQSLLTEF